MLERFIHIAIILLFAAATLPAQNPYLPGNLSGGTGVPGTKTRSPLNSMERAANNLPGATILTDTFGNQRFSRFVYISDTCLASAPPATGNTDNLNSFIKICGSDSTYYIDWTGGAVFTGGGGSAPGTCDQDWLIIGPNTCPTAITDSIYTYKYAAIGARYVWPTAEFLVNDSTATAVSVISGSRNARLVWYDNQSAKYSTVDQSGATTIWYLMPAASGSQFRITTAAGGSAENPAGPFVNQFAVNPPDSTIQAYLYPNTRRDTQTIQNFLYTDDVGKIRSQSIDTLIQIVIDTATAHGSFYNWYTRNDTTTDATRTAYILQNAEWLSVDPSGYIDMRMGDVTYGELYLDANESSLYHVDLGGNERIQANQDGINLTTSATASRAVDIITDTINWGGSFDPTYLQINYLSDETYMKADSLKTVGLGQWADIPNLNYNGTQKGFIYSPSYQGFNAVINGDGTSGAYADIEIYPNYIFSQAYFNANKTTYGTSEIDAFQAGESKWITKIFSDSYTDTASIFVAFQSNDAPKTITKYVAMGERSENDIGAFSYLGRSPASGSVDIVSDKIAWGVQQSNPNGGFLFDWLKIDLYDDDTTRNGIAFYDTYRFSNTQPSTTATDTSFHYWAGNGAGGTTPGFITLDQVCAHCSAAAAVNIFNSSGYTTDPTRIDTIQETITFLSTDGQADGVYPFRFELQDAAPNEPEMMVWDFPGAGDSLTLGQSDQEITFHSSNEFLLWADQFLAFQADSILLESNSVETVTSADYILTGNGANTIVKKIDGNAATAGQYLVSNGTKWVLSSGSAGDISNGGNSFGSDITIGTNDNFGLNLETANVTRLSITGAASTGGAITQTNITANTNTAADALTIRTNSTGTAASNFGGAILFQGESSTTDNRDMARLSTVWTTATDASREAKLSFQLGDNAGALTEIANFNTSSSSTGALVLGSSNAVTLTVSSLTPSQNFIFGNNSNTSTFGGSNGITILSSTGSAANTIQINPTSSSATSTGGISIAGSNTYNQTSGTRNLMDFGFGFAPTSGTAVNNALVFSGAINQTGGANGIVRALYDNRTITAAADYRSFEISVNSSSAKGIYQTGGNTKNSFVGATGFGSTTAPTDKVEITGNLALLTAGNKIKIATGSNASVGTATLSSGTITVNTTAVTASSIIFLTYNTPSGTTGDISAPAASITAGTSFVINSTSGGDNSTVNWWIIN